MAAPLSMMFQELTDSLRSAEAAVAAVSTASSLASDAVRVPGQGLAVATPDDTIAALKAAIATVAAVDDAVTIAKREVNKALVVALKKKTDMILSGYVSPAKRGLSPANFLPEELWHEIFALMDSSRCVALRGALRGFAGLCGALGRGGEGVRHMLAVFF